MRKLFFIFMMMMVLSGCSLRSIIFVFNEDYSVPVDVTETVTFSPTETATIPPTSTPEATISTTPTVTETVTIRSPSKTRG